MTDHLKEQIEADRAKGTPGKWKVRYERGCTHLYMTEHPDMHSQMCDETYYPWVPDNLTDWDRIARVPEMEARILSDATKIADLSIKLALARNALEVIRDHRSSCHAYDEDAGHVRRDFDAEDVRLMEEQARIALEAIGDGDEG